MNNALRKAVLLAIENFDEEDWQRFRARMREEVYNAPLEARDDMLDPDVALILRAHGCSIEQHQDFHRVIFPQGTTRHLFLRTSVDYCLLTLPSGLTVKQIGKPNRQYSLLFIVEEDHAGYPNTTY